MKTLNLGHWQNCPELCAQNLEACATKARAMQYEACQVTVTAPNGRKVTVRVLAAEEPPAPAVTELSATKEHPQLVRTMGEPSNRAVAEPA